MKDLPDIIFDWTCSRISLQEALKESNLKLYHFLDAAERCMKGGLYYKQEQRPDPYEAKIMYFTPL